MTAYADDNTVSVNNPAVTPGESAAQCYHDATEHLRKGAWYERAATQLKEAVRQDPKNPDYHLALGCAYADRAASIGYAAGYAVYHNDDLTQYQKNMANWEKGQQDPKSEQYGQPKPLTPPTFTAYTKDDLQLFTLTSDQAKAIMVDLAKDAEAEWKTAIGLTKTPAVRANAEYVQGWGQDMLAGDRDIFNNFFLEVTDQSSPSGTIEGLPTTSDAANSFKAAIRDDPGNAIYWQSLGDTGETGHYFTSSLPDIPANFSPADLEKLPADDQAFAAYRQALRLNPKNALLWWYIAQFEVRTDPSKGADDLKQAIAADSTNAYPMYILADSYLKQTRYVNNYIENSDVDHKDFTATEQVDRNMASSITDQDRKLAQNAIQLVEQGNQAPFCHYPMYHPPVPAMMEIAHDYMYRYMFLFPAYAQQRALARDLCGYTDVAAINGDLTTAFDIDHEIIDMGERVVGNWSMQEDWKNGQIILGKLVGLAIVNTGYTNMLRIAQHYSDPSTAQAIQEESDAFKAQQTQWRNILNQNNEIDQGIYTNY